MAAAVSQSERLLRGLTLTLIENAEILARKNYSGVLYVREVIECINDSSLGIVFQESGI